MKGWWACSRPRPALARAVAGRPSPRPAAGIKRQAADSEQVGAAQREGSPSRSASVSTTCLDTTKMPPVGGKKAKKVSLQETRGPSPPPPTCSVPQPLGAQRGPRTLPATHHPPARSPPLASDQNVLPELLQRDPKAPLSLPTPAPRSEGGLRAPLSPLQPQPRLDQSAPQISVILAPQTQRHPLSHPRRLGVPRTPSLPIPSESGTPRPKNSPETLLLPHRRDILSALSCVARLARSASVSAGAAASALCTRRAHNGEEWVALVPTFSWTRTASVAASPPGSSCTQGLGAGWVIADFHRQFDVRDDRKMSSEMSASKTWFKKKWAEWL